MNGPITGTLWLKMICSVLKYTLVLGTMMGCILSVAPADSVWSSFSHLDYRAHPVNWDMVETNDGRVVFGNQTGILIFDSKDEEWQWLSPPMVTPIEVLSTNAQGRVYVGGHNQFGYLNLSDPNRPEFISLHTGLPVTEQNFGKIESICVGTHGVYFQTRKKIFRWQHNTFQIWTSETSYQKAFIVFDQLYVQQWGVGLLQLQGNNLQLVKNGDQFAREEILSIVPYDNNSRYYGQGSQGMTVINIRPNLKLIMIATATRGLFVYDRHTFEPYATEADEFIREHELTQLAIYDNQTPEYMDNYFILQTRRGGVAIVNPYRQVKQIVDESRGFPSNTIYFARPDRAGNLWLSCPDGLYRIERRGMTWFQTNPPPLISSSTAAIPNLSLMEISGLPFIHNFNRAQYQAHGINHQIRQDERGFIYVGNRDGLLEYDGNSWQLIKVENEQPVSFSVANNGRIFVGTNGDFGYLHPHRGDGPWPFISLRSRLPDWVDEIGPVWFAEVTNDQVYFCSNRYLFRYHRFDQSQPIDIWESVSARFTMATVIDSTLLVQERGHGLLELTAAGLNLAPQGQRCGYNPIRFISRFNPDQYLIGLEDLGLFIYDRQTFRPLSTQADHYIVENRLQDGLILPDQRIVVATQKGGLVILTKQGRWEKLIDTAAGLQDNRINSLFFDNQDGLWAALNNGLSRIELFTPYSIFDERLGLRGEVKSITRHQDDLYVGTDQGVFRLQTKSATAWQNRFEPVPGIRNYCWQIINHDHTVLAATNNGVFVIDGTRAEKITDLSTYSLCPVSNSDYLLAGTEYGGSLLKNESGIWTNQGLLKFKDTTLGEKISPVALQFNLDSMQHLWLTTPGNEIYRSIKPFSVSAAIAVEPVHPGRGLPEASVRIFQLGSELLFVTANDLFQYRSDIGQFVPAVNPGNPRMTGILEDFSLIQAAEGTIWQSYGPGTLTAFKPGTQTSRVFPEFGNWSFNTIYPDEVSSIWLGSPTGLVCYDPFFQKQVDEELPIYVRRVQVGSKRLVLDNNTPLAADLESIPYQHNNLTVVCASPVYHRGLQYQFLMSGLDQDWSEWDTVTKKSYPNLREGSYQFLVRVKDWHGRTNTRTLFAIAIQPPWYRSGWAYILYSLIGLGVLSAGYRWRMRKVRAQMKHDRQIIDKLKQLDKLKDEFLANVSHELRTPLSGIIGLTESMLAGATGELPELARINLTMIASSSRRLTSLVNDILDFSKLKNNELNLTFTDVDMYAMGTIVLRLSESLIGDHNLKLINAIDPSIPLVEADENRIQQILHNLVGNAIKFTESGEVRLTAKEQDDFLAVTVSDTGMGISSDNLDKIFGSFQQADGTVSRQYGGTGLGLSVSKRLVQLHHGQIWVESEPGRGSDFTFTLPISKTKKDKISTEPTVFDTETLSSLRDGDHIDLATVLKTMQKSSVENKPKTGQQEVILIVDDEPVNLIVLYNFLSLENYQVLQAKNGQEALDIFYKNHQIDLIILDIMMPKMSGYEVSQRIRQTHQPNQTPIVMLTAKDRVSDLVMAFDAGANDYLTKPFSKSELLSRIRTHLRLAKINQAYGRFVPHEFLRILEKESIIDVKLGDQIQKDLSIMFADIRDFTAMSEQMSPADIFRFLNSFLLRLDPIISAHHGFIDKYVGDGIMALFPTHADDALQAAVHMLKAVREYNYTRQRPNRPPIKLGIGLNTGISMLGTVGGLQRMDGTVISDAVNVASRIESMTKVYGIPCLISGDTYRQLEDPGRYAIRIIDRAQVKGKSQPITIYEVFEGDADKMIQLKQTTLDAFRNGYDSYWLGDYPTARKFFAKVLNTNPEDQVARVYLQRCEFHQVSTQEKKWSAPELVTQG